jgi:hypothetical protein
LIFGRGICDVANRRLQECGVPTVMRRYARSRPGFTKQVGGVAAEQAAEETPRDSVVVIAERRAARSTSAALTGIPRILGGPPSRPRPPADARRRRKGAWRRGDAVTKILLFRGLIESHPIGFE